MFCLSRVHLGMDLIRPEGGGNEGLFKAFWHHTDAIVCCAWKVLVVLVMGVFNIFCEVK